ncbi:MAG: GNAT family N-acetyltransferase [Spirochaetales bacterium]|nr:GNAT family N-acetyltransferase [Spirochaetales bacterium]
MILRPAIPDDENQLLQWRNDSVTRQASLTQHIIGKNEHARWLRDSFSNPSRKIYVAEKDGVPIGTFRVDSQNDLLFLSWTIAPSWRHLGYGREMVESVRIEDNKSLKAIIRKNNIPSVKLALHLGMSLQSEKDGLLYFVKK